MASQTPEALPELIAYMNMIVQVSLDYAGLAWVCYDAAYQHQAAIIRDT